MKVHYATTNKGKVESLRSVLSPYGIVVVHEDISLAEPRTDDLEEIARRKAMAAFELLKKPVVTHDAGFYIQSLNGFPRAFVNFALETIGITGILKLVEGKSRICEFRNCIAYHDADVGEPVIFSSVTAGILTDEPRGAISKNAWSDLWLIFKPAGENQTLAEMSVQELLSWRETVRSGSYGFKLAKWLADNRRS